MSQANITSSQRKARIEIARLTVASLTGTFAGTVAGIPEGFPQMVALKSAAGTFQVKLNNAFGRIPVAQITVLHASLSLKPLITAITTTTLSFVVRNDAGALTDPTEIHISLTGSDSADGVI